MIALKNAMLVGCRMCSEIHTIPVTQEQIDRWQGGELIQNVMPELSADQRELLMSQTCGDCWEKMFPPEDFA